MEEIIVVEFGVKSGGHDIIMLNKDRISIKDTVYLDMVVDAVDFRCSDKMCRIGRLIENGDVNGLAIAGNLPAVSVSGDADRQLVKKAGLVVDFVA